MKEIIGTQAKQNVQLNSNEVLAVWTDFTGMVRYQVYGFNEDIPSNIANQAVLTF